MGAKVDRDGLLRGGFLSRNISIHIMKGEEVTPNLQAAYHDIPLKPDRIDVGWACLPRNGLVVPVDADDIADLQEGGWRLIVHVSPY